MALVHRVRRASLPGALLAALWAAAPATAQTGHVLNAAGPVNNSMAGASTALPLDASGALFWNPATLSGLRGSEADFGFETILGWARLSSTYAAGAFGRAGPPVTLSGTSGDSVLIPVPNFALAWKSADSPLCYGVSVQGLAGFSLNYGVNPANPITTPQPPRGLGFGAIYSDYQVLQLAPAAAYRLTQRWSVGLGPTVDLASLAANPFPFAPPDDANGDGFATYPSALHKEYAWGAGFQAGLYYSGPQGFHWGVCFKSPQWFGSFHFKSEDELGRPRSLGFDLDFPMIVTTGFGYTGLEHFQFALDLRYIDYKDTNGFGETGFDPHGAVRGLGWRSMFVTAFGVQYAPAGPFSFRVGYSYNTDPVPNENTGFNLASPSINEHTAYCGLSYCVADNWVLSLTYGHGFTNSISGPLQTPAGPVPGTLLRSEGGADSVLAGLTMRF
jgi:long-chain fatty acid transport protein